jgi:hypothetical protein
MKPNITIRNCEITFRFQCPKLWSELTQTESPDTRHCSVCDCDVFFCKTDEETIEHAKAGHCIARVLPDDRRIPRDVLGKPKIVPKLTPEQEEAEKEFARERGIDDSIKNADADRSCPQCNYPAPRWRLTCRVCGFEMGRQLGE